MRILKSINAIFGLMIVILSGCATTPQTPEEKSEQYIKEAISSLQSGDSHIFNKDIDKVLEQQNGYLKIEPIFLGNSKAKSTYIAYLNQSILDISYPQQADSQYKNFIALSKTKLFTNDEIKSFNSNLVKTVSDGNNSGKIPFDLGDSTTNFTFLKDAEHQKIILDRTIIILQTQSSGHRPVNELMAYVQAVGSTSINGKKIGDLLPTMKVKQGELEIIGKYFPVFAKERKEQITEKVFVQFKNTDRLISDDLLQIIRSRFNGIEWASSIDKNSTTLIIERIKSDEKILPERIQTITYAQHEVNLFNAILLMPSNASYLYDVVSGGAEIEFGYAITATKNEKQIFDELVRGRVTSEYARCQNQRIQNVFGGVTSAGFIANADMQQRCSRGNSTSLENLRNEILIKVAGSISKIPSIKNIQDFN